MKINVKGTDLALLEGEFQTVYAVQRFRLKFATTRQRESQRPDCFLLGSTMYPFLADPTGRHFRRTFWIDGVNIESRAGVADA
jgi:hypothetical protein